MKNKDVKDKVKTAFESVTPDDGEQIRSRVETVSQVDKPAAVAIRKNTFIKRFAVAAACLIVLVLGGLGVYGYNMNFTTVTEISFDVNPSMTMTLNGKGRVRSVTANNADAQRVLEGLDFEGSTYEVAANAIIGAMLRTGYLSELSNSVLVSVNDSRSQRSKTIESNILAEIQRIFTLENFDGAIICQSVTDNGRLQALADEYGITIGKANLIEKIINTQSAAGLQTVYTFRDLAGLTINELNVLAESLSVNLGDSASGTASTQGYIGEQRAYEQALAFALVNSADVTGNMRAEFDFEGGVIVYEVSFRTSGGCEYEVKVGASSGEFVELSEDLERMAGPMGEALAEDEIRLAAMQKAGLTGTESLTGYRISRDEREYEVSFGYDGFVYEIDVRLDGVVMSYDKKTDVSVPGGDTSVPGEQITAQQAKEIAFSVAAQRWQDFDADNVREYDDEGGRPEREDGVLAYEIEFKCGRYEYEFRIKASDGTVIKAERERDD